MLLVLFVLYIFNKKLYYVMTWNIDALKAAIGYFYNESKPDMSLPWKKCKINFKNAQRNPVKLYRCLPHSTEIKKLKERDSKPQRSPQIQRKVKILGLFVCRGVCEVIRLLIPDPSRPLCWPPEKIENLP